MDYEAMYKRKVAELKVLQDRHDELVARIVPIIAIIDKMQGPVRRIQGIMKEDPQLEETEVGHPHVD